MPGGLLMSAQGLAFDEPRDIGCSRCGETLRVQTTWVERIDAFRDGRLVIDDDEHRCPIGPYLEVGLPVVFALP